MNSQKNGVYKNGADIEFHCAFIGHNDSLRNLIGISRKTKRAHRRHLPANGKPENKRNIYCTNVDLRIIEILITLMYKLSAVTLMPLHTPVSEELGLTRHHYHPGSGPSSASCSGNHLA